MRGNKGSDTTQGGDRTLRESTALEGCQLGRQGAHMWAEQQHLNSNGTPWAPSRILELILHHTEPGFLGKEADCRAEERKIQVPEMHWLESEKMLKKLGEWECHVKGIQEQS